jgi:hypothetical protein
MKNKETMLASYQRKLDDAKEELQNMPLKEQRTAIHLLKKIEFFKSLDKRS